MQAEQKRLVKAKRPDLAAKIKPVWNRPALGYDIESWETDGTPRHIEVKAARVNGKRLSFFLTENERNISQSLPNYHFYLVLNVNSSRPTVLTVTGVKVVKAYLSPINYRVAFSAGG